jgi:hypothetical protein
VIKQFTVNHNYCAAYSFLRVSCTRRRLKERKSLLRADREIRVRYPNITEATKTKVPEQLVKEINSRLGQGIGSFLGV